MITIRQSQERGHAKHGWLDSYHSFSFADYYDSQWMGFRSLRVINEDRVAASQGFGTHPHKDMEIITYVLSGQVKHKDSMGNEGVIKPGEVQKMSAGTGVMHSEFSGSSTETAHFLQIWIVPDTKNLKPMYEQNLLPQDQKDSLIEFPVSIHQDAKIFRGRLTKAHDLSYKVAPGRGVWIQMVSGSLSVNDKVLEAGDAAVIEKETDLKLIGQNNGEFLLFDLK